MKKPFRSSFVKTLVLLMPLSMIPLGSSALVVAAPEGSAVFPQTTPSVTVRPIRYWNPVQDKNFYLLSLLENTPGVAQALNSDAALKRITAEHTAKLATGFNGGVPLAASIETFQWSVTEIDEAAQSLRNLYRSNKIIKDLVEGPLRQSAMYERYRNDAGAELLVKAWRDAAGGINRLVQVYGLGQAPRYPKIDSAFYDVKSGQYSEIANLIFGTLAEDESAHQLFFQPTLRVAMALMDANRRDEAGRFEPMEQGENKAAFKRVSQINWANYPYALILVPGQGPEEKEVQLSPKAKLVLASVALRYRQGKAPFIAVSGGYVHPNQTPFCEAIEMKKSLMDDYGIPENAILIDPHARHTTTNMRNVTRIMLRYGIPIDKNSLITTTPAQSRVIEKASFMDRCTRELGYEPIQVGKRTTPFDLEFRPLRDSLQIDPTDPLDP